ncbi:hypothetical protein J3D55_004567 [Chryseobacterium ginsenosidimutans]|uniref:hypothetical protein n=1 Tax=Chryseobacterium ginsenosidimutans TaxID=687846 RepID=UPI00286D74F4|nr:hypothetical protein [Chryseobacterium ginsenosidimutans]MCS3871651.1 hypothetical protein [Chryseobacterium ginsenosidimutans]
MKKLFTLLLLVFLAKINAQTYSGEVFLRDNSVLYLNQVYVTNLNTQKTVLTDYNGDFTIPANQGDVIRFTSIVTERKDYKLTSQMMDQKNLIELKIAYHDIQEVVINRFRPTGNLRYDVNAIRKEDKGLAIKKVIGLPETERRRYFSSASGCRIQRWWSYFQLRKYLRYSFRRQKEKATLHGLRKNEQFCGTNQKLFR